MLRRPLQHSGVQGQSPHQLANSHGQRRLGEHHITVPPAHGSRRRLVQRLRRPARRWHRASTTCRASRSALRLPLAARSVARRKGTHLNQLPTDLPRLHGRCSPSKALSGGCCADLMSLPGHVSDALSSRATISRTVIRQRFCSPGTGGFALKLGMSSCMSLLCVVCPTISQTALASEQVEADAVPAVAGAGAGPARGPGQAERPGEGVAASAADAGTAGANEARRAAAAAGVQPRGQEPAQGERRCGVHGGAGTLGVGEPTGGRGHGRQQRCR